MFKKMLAVTALLLAGTTAIAEDRLTLGVRHDDFVGSTRSQQAFIVNYDHRMNDKLQVGLGLRLIERNTYDKNNNRLTNRYMLRVNYELTDLIYINSAIGSKNQSLAQSTEFWQTEVGLKYRLNDTWQVRAGYAYREGFKGKADDYYKGPRLGVQYRIDPRYTLNVQYDMYEFLNEDRNRISVNIQKRLF
jgi:hypothetical protein